MVCVLESHSSAGALLSPEKSEIPTFRDLSCRIGVRTAAPSFRHTFQDIRDIRSPIGTAAVPKKPGVRPYKEDSLALFDILYGAYIICTTGYLSIHTAQNQSSRMSQILDDDDQGGYDGSSDVEDNVNEKISRFASLVISRFASLAPYLVCAILGVRWSSEVQRMFAKIAETSVSLYSNTTHAFNHTTRTVHEWWSDPSTSTAIVSRMAPTSSAPVFIFYVTVSMIIGQIVYVRLGTIMEWPASVNVNTKYVRANARTPSTIQRKKKKRPAVSADEVEPVGQFEETLVRHGWLKIKKTRKNGRGIGLRTTHRFITPLKEELSGKKAARQYLQNLSELK